MWLLYSSGSKVFYPILRYFCISESVSSKINFYIFLFEYSKFKWTVYIEDGGRGPLDKESSNRYLRMFTLEVRMHFNLSLYALRLISLVQSPPLPIYFTFKEDWLQSHVWVILFSTPPRAWVSLWIIYLSSQKRLRLLRQRVTMTTTFSKFSVNMKW